MNVRLGSLSLFFLVLLGAQPRLAFAANITIDTVPVGNRGNVGELSGAGVGGFGVTAIVGAVAHNYRIATTEVTNAQYAAFLNAKAASDSLGLYSLPMGVDIHGGITRSGVNGSYTYATKPNMANKPVNFVNWYDAIRFANWLHNGQGSGSTETGAYTILGGSVTPSNGLSITRNPGAKWYLPSEDEWYKAAYHQPAEQGGNSTNYWPFALGSNLLPTAALANSLGDISNPGANVANYRFNAGWNDPTIYLTTVGSAGPLSASFYGTYDQNGNVWEWNEALISGSLRGIRGGSYGDVSSVNLWSAFRENVHPSTEFVAFGFRVATVPEPGTITLAILAGLSLASCRVGIRIGVVRRAKFVRE